MNMKTGSRIIAGLSIAALLMVSAACKQANGNPKPDPDQAVVDAAAKAITGEKLTALQGAFTPKLENGKAEIPADTTDVTLNGETVKDLKAQLGEVKAEIVFVAPKDATAEIKEESGKYTVTHGNTEEKWDVVVMLIKGKAKASKTIGTYTVKAATGGNPGTPDAQAAVDAEAGKVTGEALKNLQKITSTTGTIQVTDAATAVELAKTVTDITLPALPVTENDVQVKWVSSDAAIELNSAAGGVGQATVKHTHVGDKTVTIKVKFSKTGASAKEVLVATFTVKGLTDEDLVDAEAGKLTENSNAGLKELQKITATGGSITVTDAATAVVLEKAISAITFPALPQTANGVTVAWVSSNAAIKVNTQDNGVGAATVTHALPPTTDEEVIISVKFTSNAVSKEVPVAKFTVKALTEQDVADAEAAKLTADTNKKLKELQAGITGTGGDVTVADAATAVELATSITAITLPALPQTENDVQVKWVSSDAAIELNSAAGGVGQATVKHTAEASGVIIKLVFTKGSATKEVDVAKFDVKQ